MLLQFDSSTVRRLPKSLATVTHTSRRFSIFTTNQVLALDLHQEKKYFIFYEIVFQYLKNYASTFKLSVFKKQNFKICNT